MEKRYMFVVETSHIDKVDLEKFSDKQNEYFSSASMDDAYDAYELDFVGTLTSKFNYRSVHMKEKYPLIEQYAIPNSKSYLVFTIKDSGIIGVRNYIKHMNFCRILDDIHVLGYSENENFIVVTLYFDDEFQYNFD